MWKRLLIGWLAAGAGIAGLAQMHKVEKPETVVRAVGVYEWTGDMAKPTASRLIPVTLYINDHLVDAGLYLAQPVPFALDTGTVYELQHSGEPKGWLNLEFARHLQAATAAEAYDDGWFGYGAFKSLAAARKEEARRLPPARISRVSGIEIAGVDDSRPHFVNREGKEVTPVSDGGKGVNATASGAQQQAGSSGNPPADPDRPTFKRPTEGKTSDTVPTGSAPAEDPDRPKLHRPTNESASTGGGNPAADPDRPTLKRRTPEQQKKASEEAAVSGIDVPSLNNDPNRPILHRGRPEHALTLADFPKLAGMPINVKQMVAVSDAANRTEHDFARSWEDGNERAAILGKMEMLARQQLAAYNAARPVPPAAPVTRPGRPGSKLRRPAKRLRTIAPPVPLLDEQLRGFTLSYGDVPTFVFEAHTQGEGASLEYVTIVAQRNLQGEPQVVLHNVTDAAHLDLTPRMKLVDAVDVDASNRASLLFELRGQNAREFAVYRVVGLQAQQTFSTGTMQ